MSKQQLTVQEAKEQGYKYATLEFGEGELIPLEECDSSNKYVLTTKEGKPFTVSDELVKDLVDDYLSNQDEVADEDGYLNELAEKVDYTDITKRLNNAFSTTNYFYATNIKLIL